MSVDVGGTSSAKSEPNVVPLCDILLVLLIIFMVVTPMVNKGNAQLPDAQNVSDQPEPGQLMTVLVKKDKIFVEQTTVEDIGKLEEAIVKWRDSNQKTDTKVLLKADKDINYGRIREVMTVIKDVGIEVIGLVTERRTSSGG